MNQWSIWLGGRTQTDVQHRGQFSVKIAMEKKNLSRVD